jgi:hypothetical protein
MCAVGDGARGVLALIFERAHGVAVEDAAVQLGPVAPLGAEQTIEDGGAEAKVAGPAGVVEGVIGEGVGGPRVAPLAGAPRVAGAAARAALPGEAEGDEERGGEGEEGEPEGQELAGGRGRIEERRHALEASPGPQGAHAGS